MEFPRLVSHIPGLKLTRALDKDAAYPDNNLISVNKRHKFDFLPNGVFKGKVITLSLMLVLVWTFNAI